ncbi:MAG: hypothetical protein GTO67_09500 [Gammaproteobacteria bacterium]|nr:hypothetical protein [Gammaproteobacteria bacterium]NIM73988.1 hypothetical protein [Gammaproteobacteria bacterium]NIN38869.1 hypothetical protein [Gammaproteobacteria bacterium]NIO25764.1 hypothetical protein [Gammaproteobacteria bacterium]NIO66394.1 hypothetical protein [Gammaproteobacteria bacterium]
MTLSSPFALRAAGGLLVAATFLLGGCSGTALVKNCCYDGEEAVVYLDEVEFVAADGSVSKFADVYPGFAPQESFFTTLLPFRKVNNALVVYDSLVLPLSLYDANKNGFTEEPELTVLYLREGALGMGHQVDHLAVGGKRYGAITTSPSYVGGLMQYLNARKDSLPPETQAIFRDLVQVGQDIKLRGSEGPDRQKKYKP